MYKREDEYIVNMRIPKELIDKVKEVASRNRISLTAQVRIALVNLITEELGNF